MLRMNDVMLLLKVSRATVYKWMKNGLPFSRVGKLVFFERESVISWVSNNGI